MRIEMDFGALRLGPGQTLKVRNGVGCTIRIQEGSVWITEEKNPVDVFLRPGQSFELSGKGLALVEAIGQVCLSLAWGSERPWRAEQMLHYSFAGKKAAVCALTAMHDAIRSKSTPSGKEIENRADCVSAISA